MNKEKWEIKKLGEVCEPKQKILRASKFFTNDDLIQYIDISSINNITNQVIVSSEYLFKNAPSRAQQKVEIGDILVSLVRPNLNNVAIVSENKSNYVASSGFCVLRSKLINTNFLFLIIKSEKYRNFLVSKTSGANYPAVREDDVKSFQIPIPPLSTQEKIVSELDTLHRLKELQEQQLAELDNLAQSTFYHLFGDPIENEKGWEVRKLGEVCEITSSKRIFAEEYQEIGVPFYRSKEVIEKSKKLSISLELFISEERYLEVKTAFGVPKIGDILMTAVGTIGEVWVVDTIEPFYFKDGNIVWLKMNNSHNSFFFEFALNKLVNEYKKKMSIGSAYSALTIINLKNMQVIIPPLSIQNHFAERIEKIEAQKELVKRSIAETQTLIDYTMDKYFG